MPQEPSSVGLGFGTRIGRTQLFPTPMLDKNRFPNICLLPQTSTTCFNLKNFKFHHLELGTSFAQKTEIWPEPCFQSHMFQLGSECIAVAATACDRG